MKIYIKESDKMKLAEEVKKESDENARKYLEELLEMKEKEIDIVTEEVNFNTNHMEDRKFKDFIDSFVPSAGMSTRISLRKTNTKVKVIAYASFLGKEYPMVSLEVDSHSGEFSFDFYGAEDLVRKYNQGSSDEAVRALKTHIITEMYTSGKMLYNINNKKVIYYERHEKTNKVKKVSKKKKRQGKKDRVIVVNKPVIIYTGEKTDKEERVYERHTESWSVKGHYRTYKSTGKRIWINGYNKGERKKETNQDDKKYVYRVN